jgi:vancomycin permeability regulator SanA
VLAPLLLAPLVVAAATVLGCRSLVARRAAGHVVTDPALATGRVAIVLGAGLRPDGSPAGVLARRVEAAVGLLTRGRVERLVMSGDDDANGDQPAAMARYASGLGAPADRVELDRSGYDTAATCRAAAAAHGDGPVVLVTQQFHAPRTAYLARKAGRDAVVLATPDGEILPGPLARARSRVVPAAVKAVLLDRL